MTPNEIKQRGYEPITSEQQLRELPDGFYLFASNMGTTVRVVKRGEDLAHASSEITPKILAGIYIGFRHIPEAPVAEPVDGEGSAGLVEGCVSFDFNRTDSSVFVDAFRM